MKIKCKKLNAVISEKTCIARHAKAIKQNNGSLTWGNSGGGIDESLEKCIKCKTGKKLYEETDYVICAEHPVYGIFELGCWMCSFDDFLLKMAIDKEFVNRFFEALCGKRVTLGGFGGLDGFGGFAGSWSRLA